MTAAKAKKVTTTAAKKSTQHIARRTRSRTSKCINSTANGHVEEESDTHRRSGFESPDGHVRVVMDEAAPAQSTSQNDGLEPREENGQSRYSQSSRDIVELEKALSVTKGGHNS
jgi:hypothetical protein